jgi:DNA-binding MarR family transcriptional regulator
MSQSQRLPSRKPASEPAGTTYLISQAWFAMRDRVERGLKPHGVTGMQFSLLSTLDHRGNQSSAQLSRRFYVTPQAMGQVLNNLEEAGWLTRTEDPANRRVLQVNLTQAGRELVRRCEAEVRKIEDAAFAGIDAKDLAEMRAMLRSFVTHVRENAG